MTKRRPVWSTQTVPGLLRSITKCGKHCGRAVRPSPDRDRRPVGVVEIAFAEPRAEPKRKVLHRAGMPGRGGAVLRDRCAQHLRPCAGRG